MVNAETAQWPPIVLSLDYRAAIRLGWLALLQTPSEIFTEYESDPPQAF